MQPSPIGARLAAMGDMMLAGSPADFGRLIADEAEKWGEVIRTANIKPVVWPCGGIFVFTFVLEHIPLTFTCSLRERKSWYIPAR